MAASLTSIASDVVSTGARWFGRLGLAFVIVLAAYILVPSAGVVRGGLAITLAVLGVWLFVRALRTFLQYATWRLRNRLLVTYVFIVVVPILLIAFFAFYAGRA